MYAATAKANYAQMDNTFIESRKSSYTADHILIELPHAVHGAWPYLGSKGLREMTSMSHICCRCSGAGCQPPALIVPRAAATGAV